MLNRGEIAMGPVWVDMFYTWQSDGRLCPELKLKLIGPGMPGQPMHYVVPAGTPNKTWRKKFVALATGRKCRRKASSSGSTGIPASTPRTCSPQLDPATWYKLFTDMTPEELATKGKPFPIGPYFDEILEAYERRPRTSG